MARIPIDIDDLSERQMLRAVLYETHGMRKKMADLNQAVADLQTAHSCR